jgi:ABC-2 type transport system permease protein
MYFSQLWKEASMSGNAALIEVRDRGRLNGFGPLWRKENHTWWAGGSWLMKILIWVVVVDGLLAMITFAAPLMESGDSGQMAEAAAAAEPMEVTAMTMFFLFAGVFPAFGVIIFGPEGIVEERKTGTAAWILSKPVSRPAFLLSKLCAQALGILATMVLPQGIIGYILYTAATGVRLSIPGFLAGESLVLLLLLFFQTLNLMLGTFFHTRGPVVGIPIGLIMVSFLAVSSPMVGSIFPSTLVLGFNPPQVSLAAALALGQPLPSVMPIISTALLTVVFVVTALLRFEREEF